MPIQDETAVIAASADGPRVRGEDVARAGRVTTGRGEAEFHHVGLSKSLRRELRQAPAAISRYTTLP